MDECRLEGGGTITDADIDRICDEFESESWTGHLERIHPGPAALPDEPLVTVAVKFPQSMVGRHRQRARGPLRLHPQGCGGSAVGSPAT